MATAKKAEKKKILVIVESPSKAKTISKFLGSRYTVVASVGHVRDLPKSTIGIDIDNDFEPKYINIRGKGELIRQLKKDAKKASRVLLATDPDREGEAISWHLAHILDIDPDSNCRIEFNEITKKAISEAVKSPRPINTNLVDAQQARRVLDRLVGYQISPLLWRKIKRGLSAGRVQSAALKIICDRENAINEFVPEEYWTVSADFKKGKKFTAKLAAFEGKKISVANCEQADEIEKKLSGGEYTVSSVEKKLTRRRPYAPFTTSTLQQDASNKLNFNTKKTMMIAQQLYEGVSVKGHGTIGLVSYIRTDSVRLSDEARAAARDMIVDKFGERYWSSNFYTNKKKEIQDAHEAIRPAHVDLLPEDIRDSLTADQFKLYNLIYTRFLASQMSAAEFDSMTVLIDNGPYTFRATGSRVAFEGFRKVYSTAKGEDDEKMLPELAEGEKLIPSAVNKEQNFTQPLPRYTEAALVKELEDKNIGRPSTYAPIVGTLVERRYITRSRKQLVPTELGFTVNGMMNDYFKEIVDTDFTADMEDRLDDVEVGTIPWKRVVSDFYEPLSTDLKRADEEIEKVVIEDEPTGEMCELCGKPMVRKQGRFGAFIACSGYPECRNTKAIVTAIDVKCPKCGKDIVQRRSKKGKLFYGCSGYPECDTVFWYRPVNDKCPECGSLLVEKGKEKKKSCSNPECKYKE
ncbi:MAG: type I DNA topoisomerase [Firmicutes bacterium]|nr:type I DNA topoisomerase [Bacillota bacterium]